MDARHWTDGLVSIGACSDAVDWARQYDSLQSAWDACERGNWMMWLWARVDAGAPWSDARRPLVLAACECARLAMAYVAQGATCPLVAIETAESWARGEHNDIDRLLAAANAAYAAANAANAANAAYAANAADAAYAAAYAAYAAANAANAAYAAAYAAYAAANAANAAYAANAADAAYAAAYAAYAAANAANAAYAAAYAAYAAARKKCADIVRKHRPKAPELKGDPE